MYVCERNETEDEVRYSQRPPLDEQTTAMHGATTVLQFSTIPRALREQASTFESRPRAAWAWLIRQSESREK